MTTPTVPATAMAACPMLGGEVSVHLCHDADPDTLGRDAERVLERIRAWAGLLTRFDAGSELSRLNADPRGAVPVGPTLAAVLDWAREAETITGGLVDVAMLDARLAAENGRTVDPPLPASRRWSLDRRARGAVVMREPGVRFDLDGVAKGWLADRALDLSASRSALVDGDGDVAARLAPGDAFHVGIADPRDPDGMLGLVRLGAAERPRRFGLATSGTSVHRWTHGPDVAHHLIDPATWRPAATDVVQATVLAATARAAEAFAKVAVIAGSEQCPALLDRPGVLGALMLTTSGEIRATPGMLRWLA